MRGTELYRDFVPQGEDFYISINSLYWALERRRQCQIEKIVLGKYEICQRTKIGIGRINVNFFEGGLLCVRN